MNVRADQQANRSDRLLAFGFALLLGLAWTWRDWANLSALHLPDTDDVVRLQQIRDWLGGQSFGDVRQYRLGGGLAMHWSRLPDLVPGAIIALLRPLIGTHTAEVAAVIAWPIMLFGAVLALIASITRRLAPTAARTAIIVGGLAYPVTTLFAPGRIDHHGLQIVLLLIAVRALIARASWASGVVAGGAIALSLIVGIELAPVLSVAALSVWLRWWLGRPNADGQLAGLGAGLSGILALGAAAFATTDWGYPACDSFTRITWLSAQIAAAAPLVLGLAGPMLGTRSLRLAASLALMGAIALPLMTIAQPCAAPYGAVDPLVARLWLARVGEAQSLFVAPIGTAIAYVGLLIAGIAATWWQAAWAPGGGWALLLALSVAALGVASFELRGVYAGVILGTPALAAAIGAARSRGVGWLTGAWLGSAGMLYPIAAQAFTPPSAAAERCDAASAVATLPAGATVMAPMDSGAYALAAGRQRLIAAPYHRNNAGNAAMYRFFLGSSAQAQAITRAWRINYVVLCPGDFSGRFRAPPWLTPIPDRAGAHIWRIERRLR